EAGARRGPGGRPDLACPPGPAGGQHRGRRRVRRRVPARRGRSGSGGGRAGGQPARSDAVTTLRDGLDPRDGLELLDVSAEVREALAAGGPVVALETTLVSHGFPGTRG